MLIENRLLKPIVSAKVFTYDNWNSLGRLFDFIKNNGVTSYINKKYIEGGGKLEYLLMVDFYRLGHSLCGVSDAYGSHLEFSPKSPFIFNLKDMDKAVYFCACVLENASIYDEDKAFMLFLGGKLICPNDKIIATKEHGIIVVNSGENLEDEFGLYIEDDHIRADYKAGENNE